MKLIYTMIFFSCISFALKSQVTDKRTGITIEFEVTGATFPNSWKKSPIEADGEDLEYREKARSIAAVKKALNKYPVEVIRNNLKKIYVLKSIRFYGVKYGGTNSTDIVYIANNGKSMGYTDRYLEKSFHHEFSSILLRNYPQYFNESKWTSVNELSYGKGGVEALKSNTDGQTMDEFYNSKGFLYEYARSSMENDFNSYAENLFAPKSGFYKTINSYAKLKHKYKLAVQFYNSVNSSFSIDYFNKMKNNN